MHKVTRPRMLLVITVFLFLHLTLLDYIKIFGVKPDLMFIPVVFFGVFLGRGAGLEAGLMAGLGKDLFALDFFGINALIMALAGVLAGMLGAQFSRESNKTLFLMVLFLNALSMSLHFVIASIFSRWIYLGFGEYLIGSVIPTSLYTAAFSIPVILRLMKTYGLRFNEEYL